MNTHKLLVLGGVAAVALAAALWSTSTRTPVQDESPSETLVPGLEAKLNDVDMVRVRGPGGQVLATMQRGGEGWNLQERDGYAVDVPKLRAYLLKLAQARRVEEKTSNPALYDRLGVEAVDSPQAFGAQLELDGIQPPVKLILGRNVPRGSGTYARFADQPQSWEANADLALERSPAAWLLRDLVDIAPSRIERVEVKPADGAAILVQRATPGSQGEFVLASVPKGREPASEFVADALAGLLSGLKFDDVLSARAVEPPPAGLTVSTFTTEDGITLVASTWAHDEKTHASLAATFDEARAAQSAAEDATAQARAGNGTAPPPPAVDGASRVQAVREEAATLSKRFEGRIFVLPPYKADVLDKPLEGYLKPKA